MCTPNSHLPALVRLNQAEKDNEAFYLDATDFIYSPRDLQLFVFEFEALTLSCKVPLIQEEKSCRGEKIEENQKKRVMHKFQKRQCCRSIFSSSFTALCLQETHSCCSELEQGSSYKEKIAKQLRKK